MSIRIRFEPSGRTVEVESGTTLFDAVIAADLPIASSCGADGMCGRCGLRVMSGTLPSASAREVRVSAANRLDGDLRLSCMVLVTEDLVVTADYW
jgi:ferredoxin